MKFKPFITGLMLAAAMSAAAATEEDGQMMSDEPVRSQSIERTPSDLDAQPGPAPEQYIQIQTTQTEGRDFQSLAERRGLK